MRRFLGGSLILGVLVAVITRERGVSPVRPSDLAAITFTATDRLTPAFALVHLFAEDGFKGSRQAGS